jgi:hypothetical protein
MEEQEVDLVDPKLAGAFLEAVQSFVVAVVTDPDLRSRKTSDRLRCESCTASPTWRSLPYAAAVSMRR